MMGNIWFCTFKYPVFLRGEKLLHFSDGQTNGSQVSYHFKHPNIGMRTPAIAIFIPFYGRDQPEFLIVSQRVDA